MEADIILQKLEAVLTPRVEQAGGRLQVCGTPADTLLALNISPVNWNVFLQWGGNENSGERGAEAYESILAVVHTSKGFHIHPGNDVYVNRSGGGPPFIRLCAMVRNWIKAVRFYPEGHASSVAHPTIDTCHGLVPKGTKWLAGGLEELAAVREAVITFEIHTVNDAADPILAEVEFP